MRVLLINPPYHAISCTYGLGVQTPSGLLAIGGPLLDAGHTVRLLDAEIRHLSLAQIVAEVQRFAPDVVMTSHGGSTPAHPTVCAMAQAIKRACPQTLMVYGGVYPTYHGAEILAAEAAIDFIVRGEGEQTAVNLLAALSERRPLASVPGLFLRGEQGVITTPAPVMIERLDDYRVGWELIEDWDVYQCWDVGRAAIIQFSRGCPHQCTYCGQRGFWTRWRYRTPEKVAAEIAWLHRTHGVNFVDLADENPTTSPRLWRRFLEAMIAEAVPVKLFASLRTTDIVRDADILPRYKAAGFECFIIGLETTDPALLARIRKGSTQTIDQQAIALLHRHGMLSMVTQIFGLAEERWRDYWRTWQRLRIYDPDMLNGMFMTPHRWTPFYAETGERMVIEKNHSHWDYRHQVLATRYLLPWQVFVAVKALEFAIHLRPHALWRLLRHPDTDIRRALRWCTRRATRVWWAEIRDFLLPQRTRQSGTPTQNLFEFWGAPMHEEQVLRRKPPTSSFSVEISS
ncbi:magnesium-protoporphyrin IX monomethyl ester cyclase [Betaproteobacteria bacterium]|nr:magnesium-protoporphyrin IX monomethyl ester cyclase [Betaproteobacteria bacterium]